MSGLVKAAAASPGVVTPFVPPKAPRKAAGPPAETPRMVAAEEVDRLAAELATVRADASKAIEAARVAGREEGIAAASAAEDARLALLERALVSAAGRLDESLGGIEDLAGTLAATALGKLVAPDAAMSGLVARSVQRQIRLLRRETVVAIRVSAADFPDEDALQALAAQAGAGAARLVADPQLGSGECRFDLALGHIDLGVAGRWREAASLLAGSIDSSDAP